MSVLMNPGWTMFTRIPFQQCYISYLCVCVCIISYLSPHLRCQRLGQAHETCFGGTVCTLPCMAVSTHNAPNIDDSTYGALSVRARRRLTKHTMFLSQHCPQHLATRVHWAHKVDMDLILHISGRSTYVQSIPRYTCRRCQHSMPSHHVTHPQRLQGRLPDRSVSQQR